MGKTNKPLQIWIDESFRDNTAVPLLVDQGHLVVIGDGAGDYTMTDFDIMIGPQCWRATDLNNLDLMLRGARALRYPQPVAPTRKS